MDPRLTWRGVDAPNFSGATEALRLSAALADKGLGGLNTAITDFAQAPMLQQQAQNALAQQQLNLDKSVYDQNRLVSQNRAIDSVAPILNDVALAYGRGDIATAQDLLIKNQQALSTGLGNDQLTSKLSTLNALGTGAFNSAQTVKNARLAEKQVADSQLVSDRIIELQRFSGDNPSLATQGAFDILKSLDPAQRALFVQSYSKINPNFASIAPDASTFTGPAIVPQAGANPAAGAIGNLVQSITNPNASRYGDIVNAQGQNGYDTVIAYGKYGSPSTPVSEMSARQAISFGRDVLIPATKGASDLGLSPNKGTSAVGAYQFTSETLYEYAPRVLRKEGGLDAVLTPTNQDKLAEQIYNDRKNGDLTKTWAGLSNIPGANKKGYFANIPFEQARNLILQYEIGASNPAQPSGGINAQNVPFYLASSSAGVGTPAASQSQIRPIPSGVAQTTLQRESAAAAQANEDASLIGINAPIVDAANNRKDGGAISIVDAASEIQKRLPNANISSNQAKTMLDALIENSRPDVLSADGSKVVGKGKPTLNYGKATEILVNTVRDQSFLGRLSGLGNQVLGGLGADAFSNGKTAPKSKLSSVGGGIFDDFALDPARLEAAIAPFKSGAADRYAAANARIKGSAADFTKSQTAALAAREKANNLVRLAQSDSSYAAQASAALAAAARAESNLQTSIALSEQNRK